MSHVTLTEVEWINLNVLAIIRAGPYNMTGLQPVANLPSTQNWLTTLRV